jgi:hypothetical protein
MSQQQRTSELERAQEVATMDAIPPHRESRFELSLPKIIAGSLAAAGAAVASSWLGVAGTVLGAVVGSIIVPVGTAIASRPLERSSQVIRESLPVLPALPERDRSSSSPALRRPATPVPATVARPQRHTGSVSVSARRPIRWGMLAVSCLVTLVVAFGLLTIAEEAMGRSFSSLIHGGHGGTTLSHVVHHSGSGSGTTTPPSGPDTTAPSTDPATTAPSTDPVTTAPTTPPSTDPVTTAPTTPPQTSAGATGAGTPSSGADTGTP